MNRLAVLLALLVAGSALADPTVAVVNTATSNAACAALPKGHRISIQCTTDSLVDILDANSTTALVEGVTGTYVVLRELYDTATNEKFYWGCATAATAPGSCQFKRVVVP